MKRLLILLAIILSLTLSSRAQNNIGINDDNSAPKASAMLDVFSANKGLLIPRIALTSTTAAAPVTSPETSLLIYNTATAGDVTPGYYYWNSSAWVRLQTTGVGMQKLSTVVKTVNGAILKTDNMVFGSGDITLTLPVVTSADNGLEITVKNIGTYMDVVTVTGATGSETIDGNTSSTLYKNWGRTFVAKDGNWLRKENLSRLDNVFEVSAKSSWTTIAQVVEFLGAHMTGPSTVLLGGETYPIAATQTINLPYPVTFQGVSYGETTIQGSSAVSGTPLFTCQSESYFKMLIFNAYANAAGNDGIRFTASGTYHEVKDCSFLGFNKGIVSTSNNDLWIFETDFENCAGAGVEIAAGANSGGSFKISECDFTQCAKGIHLLSGVSETVSATNCTFYNTTSGTDIGVLYVPATFTTYTSMFFSNNAWNNQGTFFSGFDFSLANGRDANVYMVGNLGSVDQKPHAKLNVLNNAATTTVTTAGTYYKAVWAANASTYTCKWTLGSTGPVSGNRITYQPNNPSNAWAIITGNLSNSVVNHVLTLAIVRNGVTTTRYGETDIRITVAGQPFQFSTVVYIPNMARNDYLELYVTSNTNGSVVTFRDLEWFTDTQ
jgi:hypothetical protein